MNTTSERSSGLGVTRRVGSRTHHSIGFWIAAGAFLLNMAFSAVPTPLYVLYQQRDGFSNLAVTVVYAVYALGVIGSLFLAGHLSDSIGRRRVFVPALLTNALSALIFILDPSLAGLLLARISRSSLAGFPSTFRSDGGPLRGIVRHPLGRRSGYLV